MPVNPGGTEHIGRENTGGSGFEPEQAEPKSAVLPLHHPPGNANPDSYRVRGFPDGTTPVDATTTKE